ncbi:MAG: O-antigen polymerase [Thermodesulfobacteriota bacterium]
MMASDSVTKKVSCPWYIHPGWLGLVFFSVIFIAWILLPADIFYTTTKARKIVSTSGSLYWGFAVVLFVLGAFLTAGVSNRHSVTTVTPKVQPSWIYVGFCLTMIGYLCWFGIAAQKVGGITQLFNFIIATLGIQSINILKIKFFQTIPGITTLTQIGVVTVALITVYLLYEVPKNKMPYYTMFALIFIFGLIRALVLSERLAVLELLIPVLVIITYRHKKTFSSKTFLPVAAIVVFYLLFTFGEYIRSWIFFQNKTDLSLWSFSFFRLLSYYTTSVNNAVFLVKENWALSTPFYYTLVWIWNVPLYANNWWNYTALFKIDPSKVWSTLFYGRTPLYAEFNTFSIPGYLYLDFGWLGLIFIFLLGVITGRLYRMLFKKNALGIVLYATWFTGLLEFPRIFYWPNGRYFPSLLFLLVLAVLNKYRRAPISR